MNPQIAKAIEHLHKANYTGYFDVMDTMPIPTQHRNAYYTQKTIFTSGQPLPPNFAQSLEVLTKEIANTIGGQTDTDKESKVPKFLTTAPFMPTIFVGRQAELEAVHHRLFGGENFLMLVNGQGGIGKTTFASKYWAQYQSEYSHLAFLYVENGIAQAILSLARVLGLAFKTEPLQEQLDILVQTVTNLQKPCLLILDNANEEQDLNDNILLLKKCANFHVLLTSRLADSAYTAKHPLGTLGKKEARTLFEKHYPLLQETEIPLFENIYEAVGGNTLVLELMAKNLTNFNNQLKKRYTLQELKNDLQNGLTRLSQSKAVQTEYQAKGTGIRHETPEAIILAMYDLASLTEAETALLSVLSVLPAENIAFETLERMNPTLTNLSQPATPLDQTLLALAQKGWIEQNETAFKISPVVQDITRHKNEHRLLIDCDKMMYFLLNNLHPYDNENYHQENYKHTTLYAYYAESITHYLPTHIDMRILLDRIGTFHETIGNLTKALELYEKQHQTIKKLASQNPHNPNFKNSLAISYAKLGNTQASIGNWQEAWRFFETYNQLMKELYDAFPSNVDYKNGLAISYAYLGETQVSVGNWQEAWHFFETYNQLMKELHDAFHSNVDYKNHLAISYERLGDTQASVGNWQEALRFFETYNQLEKELHDAFPSNVDYKNNLAVSYYQLGSIHIQLDKVTEAKDNFVLCHSLSLALYQAFSIDIDFVSNYAESLAVLNAVEALLGNTTHYTDLSKAQAIFEDLYTQSTAINFLKKADLIKQLQHTPSALKTFIIEISKF